MKKHGKLITLALVFCSCVCAQAQIDPGTDLTSMITNASCIETVSGETSTASNQLPAANWTATNGKGVIVNTWSNEGDSDGSNMTVPFAQNWDWVNLPDGTVYHDPINGMTPGIYRITCFARIFCASEDLYNGLSGVSLYANDNSIDLSEGKKCKSGGLYGYYDTYSVEVPVLNGTLNFGFKLENAKSSWVSFKNFTLTYLEKFEEDEAYELLKEYIEECENNYQNLDEIKANNDIKNNYLKAIENAKNATSNFSEYQSELGQAVQKLSESIKEYEYFSSIILEGRSVIEEISSEENYGPLSDEIEQLINTWDNDYQQGIATSEEIANSKEKMSTIIKSGILKYMVEGNDITLLVDNASCIATTTGEISTVDRQLPAANWTATNGKGVIVNTWSNEGDNDGSNMTVPFAQNWDWVNLPNGKVYHDPIKGLPIGTYRVTCFARIFSGSDDLYNGTSGVTLYANENSIDLNTGERCLSGGLRGYFANYSIDVMVNDGTLEFGFKLENAKSSWIAFKNFTLTYIQGMDNAIARKTLGEVIYEATAITGNNMYKVIMNDLNNEIEKASAIYENTNLTAEDYNQAIVALTEKINTAKKSIEEYNKIETLIAKSEDLDATGQQIFAPTIDAYDEGSIPDYNTALESYYTSVKGQTTPGCDMTGAIGNAACNEIPASSVKNWTSNSLSLVVNTWSNEGETDGSNMLVPFAQYWSEGLLPNGILKHDLITGLQKAYYQIDIFARILDWTGEVYASDETNVKFYANNIKLDLGKGSRCQTGSLFGFYNTYSITLGIDDGILDFGFILEDPHCTWLSFKDVKFTYLGTEVPDKIENIENIKNYDNKNTYIYNIAGQRVRNMQKGNIYIINGKKIMMK